MCKAEGANHADLVGEGEKVEQVVDEVKRCKGDPIDNPVRKLGWEFLVLALCVVQQLVSFVHRIEHATKELYDEQEDIREALKNHILYMKNYFVVFSLFLLRCFSSDCC